VTLQVGPAALEQRDPTTNALVASYNYKDLGSMRKVIGCPGSHGNVEAWALEMKNTGRMVKINFAVIFRLIKLFYILASIPKL
jgi:hypothetical protein